MTTTASHSSSSSLQCPHPSMFAAAAACCFHVTSSTAFIHSSPPPSSSILLPVLLQPSSSTDHDKEGAIHDFHFHVSAEALDPNNNGRLFFSSDINHNNYTCINTSTASNTSSCSCSTVATCTSTEALLHRPRNDFDPLSTEDGIIQDFSTSPGGGGNNSSHGSSLIHTATTKTEVEEANGFDLRGAGNITIIENNNTLVDYAATAGDYRNSSSGRSVINATASMVKSKEEEEAAIFYHRRQNDFGRDAEEMMMINDHFFSLNSGSIHSRSCCSNAIDPTKRSCRMCGTTQTPLWRSGPDGPKTLCNACGIRLKKSTRRRAEMLQGEKPRSMKAKRKHSHGEGGDGEQQLMIISRRRSASAAQKATAMEMKISELCMDHLIDRKLVAKLAMKKKKELEDLEEDEQVAAALLMAMSCGLHLSEPLSL